VATYEQIVEANRATFAAWNAHDPEAVAAIFASDAVIRDVGNPDMLRGRDAIRDRAFSRFDAGGLVVEDVNFWDVGALLAQLGGTA
jgi:nuclear transport factor 2 (NTF2) superfamily protein